MSAKTDQANERPNVTAGVLKRLFQVFGSLLVVAAILFISSGHLGWVWAWVYIAMGVDPGGAMCAGLYHSHRAGGQDASD